MKRDTEDELNKGKWDPILYVWLLPVRDTEEDTDLDVHDKK